MSKLVAPIDSHVKVFRPDEGYGFIAIDGSEKDLFFHATGFRKPKRLRNGTITWVVAELDDYPMSHGLPIRAITLGRPPKRPDDQMALEWTLPTQVEIDPIFIVFEIVQTMIEGDVVANNETNVHQQTNVLTVKENAIVIGTEDRCKEFVRTHANEEPKRSFIIRAWNVI